MEINTLSWLIYFAEVLSTLSFLMFCIVLLSAIVIVVAFVLWATNTFDYDPDRDRAAKAVKLGKQAVMLAAIAFTIDTILPNSRTLYLIAGSEIAHQVLDSDTAIKVKKVIDHKLDEIIEQENIE